MITGIHHIALIASSEASVDFYKRLGFEEFKRINRDYDTVVLLNGYGIRLEIFIDPTHPERSSPEPLGLRHIALRVESIEDTASELKLNTGIIMTDWLGERFTYITDPDGNVVELHE